jgi:hypothetical protein
MNKTFMIDLSLIAFRRCIVAADRTVAVRKLRAIT